MTEPPNNLESRMAALLPRPITPALESRISEASAPPAPTRAARGFFWASVAGGALAASTILVLLTAQSAGPAHPQSPGAAMSDPLQNAPSLTALASADWRWGDELYINDDRRHP
jgi:hypothetical protein